jgi:hypothetical protein
MSGVLFNIQTNLRTILHVFQIFYIEIIFTIPHLVIFFLLGFLLIPLYSLSANLFPDVKKFFDDFFLHILEGYFIIATFFISTALLVYQAYY